MDIVKTERIEIDLPQDILFAMRSIDKPEEVRKKLKMALAALLFQERSISLGKAIELAGMTRTKFMEFLKEHRISPYEYTEKDLERDQQAVADYRKAAKE
ncbi:MAG: UPF0175 family protein [Deltaproteobacteria bacterium]|nr:UPF0175 family protein [Deltaproteobacteria bacterium]